MFSSYSEVREVFETTLTEEALGVPVEYANVEKSVALESALENKDQVWCRMYLKDGDSQTLNIGQSQTRRFFGSVVLEIYVPVGQGTVAHRRIADIAADLLKRKRYANGLASRGVDFAVMGEVDDMPGFYKAAIEVGFKYERIFELDSDG